MTERPTRLFAPETLRGPFKYVNNLSAASCFCGPDEMIIPKHDPEPHRFPEPPPEADLPSPFIERRKRWWQR